MHDNIIFFRIETCSVMLSLLASVLILSSLENQSLHKYKINHERGSYNMLAFRSHCSEEI